MYKWHVKIYLDNGNIIKGMYECDERSSVDAIRKLTEMKSIPSGSKWFNSIAGLNEKSQILFSVLDISAVEISEFKEINDNE